MKILVCIKQVPDTAALIRVRPDGSGIETAGLPLVLNPYDEFALEEALRIQERHGGEVTVLSVGPDSAKEVLRTALALGADRALLLSDPAFEGSDSHATALLLARAIQREAVAYDLILCGKEAVDDGAAAVGPTLAERLGLPHVSVITKLEISSDGRRAMAHRQVEGAREAVEVSLPAILTAQKGLNEPRYPTVKGIMGAKKKEITVLTATDLGVGADEVGRVGSLLTPVRLTPPPSRPAGRILTGEPADAVASLVAALRDEAKVL